MQPHPLLGWQCLQGGDVTNSATSTGFPLMHDPHTPQLLLRPSSCCHNGLVMETVVSLYALQLQTQKHLCIEYSAQSTRKYTVSVLIYKHTPLTYSCVHILHSHQHTHNCKSLPFTIYLLNPHLIEAEGLHCCKPSIFKLDILVIS